MRRVVVAAIAGAIVTFMACGGISAGAQSGKKPDCVPSHVRVKAKKSAKAKPPTTLVAYDARDHRYYSLKWAKSHGMRDPNGDALIALPLDKLPKGANPAIAK